MAILLMVLMLTSCGDLLGGVLGVQLPDPAWPSISHDTEDSSFSIHYGESVELKVTASVSDKGELSYQWYKNTKEDFEKASKISGATKATYTVTGNSEDEAYYWCEVTNSLNMKTKTDYSSSFYVKISNVIEIKDDIDENETWNATYTYLINDDCYVNATLIIPEGTIVKFTKDSWLGSYGNGKIVAEGSADKPIIFTSETDKTVGINIYKGSESPAAGYWEGISTIGVAGSKFTFCDIRYAGSESSGAMYLEKKTTVTDCRFYNNKSPSYSSYDNGALSIGHEAIASTIEGNVFYDNEIPLSCPANYTVNPSNKFSFTDDSDVVHTNKYQGIFVKDWDIEKGKTVTYSVTEVPYVVVDGIDINGTLNIADDVILRVMDEVSIDIYDNEENPDATLILGNCIITSYEDDAHGGDINGDGSVDKAEEGAWEGIWYYSTDFKNSLNKDETKVLFNDDSKYAE